MLLLSLNDGFDRQAVDLLLTLKLLEVHLVDGSGVLQCASLIAAGLVSSKPGIFDKNGSGGWVNPISSPHSPIYTLQLTAKGNHFVDAWRKGDQQMAVMHIKDNNNSNSM